MTAFHPSPEQAAIIDAPLTPLRVAAGAGTGKTTTVAQRIAALVEAGIDPERILGLTFTNKAAEELAARVRQATESISEPGRDAEIHTYHGFAAHVLHEFGPLVGVERSTDLVTPTFSRQIFHDSLTGTFEHLDLTWSGHLDRAIQLAAALADNLTDLNRLTEAAPTEPDEVWAKRLEYAAIVSGYEAEKRRLGVIDFGDLIAKAHELVTHYPDFAERIRRRYEAVLLDEYQDTNPAQRELLRNLFGSGFPVMAVGDADQTIYEWRGASLQNFERFPEHFPTADGRPAPTLPLTVNRRSGQSILDFAGLIQQEIDGTGPGARLRALPGAEPGEVMTRWLGTALDEADFIADEIVELHETGTPWREMAVLFRKNKDIETVRAALEVRGVPVEVANLGGLLEIPEVADLWAWLRMLDDPTDSPALVRLLMGAQYRLGLGDLKPLSDWASPNADAEDSVPRSLGEALDGLEEVRDRLTDRAYEALNRFRTTYLTLLEAAQGVSLVELTRRILAETDAWPEIEAMSDAARLSARLNVYRFLDLAEEWSPLEGRPSLAAFVGHLRLLAEDQTEELDTARLSGEDAVALLTIHRAKGLEWDAVFLPAAYARNFPVTGRSFDDPYRHPHLVPYELRLDRATLPPITADMDEDERSDILRVHALDQEWRIAYVGATRSRRRLTISGAAWYGATSPRQQAAKPSPLFELAATFDRRIDLGHDEPPDRPDALTPSRLVDAPDPAFAGGWPDVLRRTIADPEWPEREKHRLDVARSYDQAVDEFQAMLFALPERGPAESAADPTATSVTGLVTYALCPRRYFWSEIDRLPRRPSSAAQRGIELHRRIELHHRGAIPFDDLDVDLYDAPGRAETHTGAFDLFLASRFSEPPRFIESPFDLRVGDATVRGRVDAIYEWDEGVWEIVDFKSGSPASNPAVDIQLQAYALAARAGVFAGRRPDDMTVTFAYFGSGELVERSQAVDDAWLEDAEKAVVDAIESIEAAQFDTTPGDVCRSCDFVRFCEPGRAFLER